MPIIKHFKAEKVSTETLAQKAMDVCREMLAIMCERSNKDGEDETTNTYSTHLHYFGTGQQIKISKVGDSLYSSLKDVMEYVMNETGKHSGCDCKFVAPKHTSYIGQIIKNIALDVIARNPRHQEYLNNLANQTSKYRFDVTASQFLSLYYDTVYRLYERGFLFEDDPELDDIRQLLSQNIATNTPDILGYTSISFFSDQAVRNRLTTRNRVIFPYIRRLVETQKAAQVTKRRVDVLIDQIQPDEDIRRAYQEKIAEVMNQNTDNQLNSSPEISRQNAHYMVMDYLSKHFSKEKIDRLNEYIKADRIPVNRSHKRYITVYSKRPRPDDLSPRYEEPSKIPNTFSEPAIKAETVESVIPNNVVLVPQTTEQTVIMPVPMAAVNDMNLMSIVCQTIS